MNVLRSETEDVSTVTVSGSAELRDAGALKIALIECLDRGRATRVDFSALERADVALLQMICSAVRSFNESEVPLSLAPPGPEGVFATAWRAAGFAALDAQPEKTNEKDGI